MKSISGYYRFPSVLLRKKRRVMIVLVCLLFCLATQPALGQLQAGGPPSFSGMVDNVKNSVVNLSTTRVVKTNELTERLRQFFGEEFGRQFGQIPSELKTSALGSGILIDREGHILTNNHVIENATEIKVKLQDQEKLYDARVVGTDPKTELALIKIVSEAKLPMPAQMGDSDAIKVGDWVFAMGNPFGLGHTVTQGIISAKGRVIGAGPYDDFLQTDAAINPGNSGGPLFNMNGHVIGINTAIVAQGHGIGFAIPINMAKELLPQLKKGKIVRGWLGLVIQNMTTDLAQYFGMEEAKGIIVAQVIKGGPADSAGLRQGDIILTLNGKEIESSSSFSRAVAELRPGEEVKLGIIRNGRQMTVPVTIGTMPEEPSREEPPQAPAEPEEGRLGFTVQNLTPQIARAIGLSPSETGVVISEVALGSPADDAGLEAGDVIREVDRQPVSNLNQFRNAVQKRKGQGMLFLIQRRDMSFYTTVVPDQSAQ